MPASAQRSPSEALSPSVGPRWDRPTAISSDVWLPPKLHRCPGASPVRLRTHRALTAHRAITDWARVRAGCAGGWGAGRGAAWGVVPGQDGNQGDQVRRGSVDGVPRGSPAQLSREGAGGAAVPARRSLGELAGLRFFAEDHGGTVPLLGAWASDGRLHRADAARRRRVGRDPGRAHRVRRARSGDRCPGPAATEAGSGAATVDGTGVSAADGGRRTLGRPRRRRRSLAEISGRRGVVPVLRVWPRGRDPWRPRTRCRCRVRGRSRERSEQPRGCGPRRR